MRMTMLAVNFIRLTVLLLALLMSGQKEARSQKPKEQEIVQGKGWGEVRIGAAKAAVDRVLGKGDKVTKFDIYFVYFVDYETKGIQVSFSSRNDAVIAIFFYNKDENYGHFATFPGKTSKGIGWDATVEQVMKAYGKPVQEIPFSGKVEGRRIVFDGIDFRFLEGKLVRISIPGK